MVFFWFLFRRQDDKGPVVVLEGGGWKLKGESLASLGLVLFGLGHSAGRHIMRTTLPPNCVFLVSF